MRPLFTASVLLDLTLDATGFDTVVLTSASSKTAYGLAHLLRRRPVEKVGLTSAARREWLVGLGLYDTVLTYDNLSELKASGVAVLVDFAGDPSLAREIHARLAGALTRSILVGFTHGTTNAGDAPHEGPASEFFFAPDEIVRHGREFARRYSAAWREFAPIAGRTLRIERITDDRELERVYRDLLAGRVDPATAYVASL